MILYLIFSTDIMKNVSVQPRTDIEILEVIIIRLNKKYKIKYNNIFQAKTSPPPKKKKKYSHSASLKVLHDIMEVYNYPLTRG